MLVVLSYWGSWSTEEMDEVAPSSSGPLTVILEGFLRKQGGSKEASFFGALNWKKRYFVLNNSQILYFPGQTNYFLKETPLGYFNLFDVKIKTNKNMEYSFTLSCSERDVPMVIRADNEQVNLLLVA